MIPCACVAHTTDKVLRAKKEREEMFLSFSLSSGPAFSVGAVAIGPKPLISNGSVLSCLWLFFYFCFFLRLAGPWSRSPLCFRLYKATALDGGPREAAVVAATVTAGFVFPRKKKKKRLGNMFDRKLFSLSRFPSDCFDSLIGNGLHLLLTSDLRLVAPLRSFISFPIPSIPYSFLL